MTTVTRLFDLIYFQQETFPLEHCLGEKIEGSWTFLSTEQVILQAESLASGMLASGWAPWLKDWYRYLSELSCLDHNRFSHSNGRNDFHPALSHH